jgi:MazG family protein
LKNKIEELKNKSTYNFDDMRAIMEILRAEDGCPWDKEQTHKSIRNNFIEEVYEAVEAIDTDDVPLLREELGDVLQQVVFHSRISEESGEFNIDDVITEVCAKLVVRHPHIFGDVKVDNTDDVLNNWDAIKQNTKGRTTVREKLDGVSKALPALVRAEKLAKKAEYVNPDTDIAPTEEAIGEALFNIAAYANAHNIDAEQALYFACEKFIEKS